MATDYLAGEEGEHFIAMTEMHELTAEERTAFNDVLIDKVAAGFNLTTRVSDDGEFYIIHWNRP